MIICAWAAANLESEPEVRTVFFASGTILSYLQNAFLPIAAFPAREAPHWRIGAKVYLGLAVTSTIMFIGIFFGLKWENKKKARNLIKDDSTEKRVVTDSTPQDVEHVQVYAQEKV